MAASAGIDLRKINPYASDHDQKVEMANQLVHKWMRDPDNRRYLDDKKAEYIHKKGYSNNRTMKHECDLPPGAFLVLPSEIRNNKKELMKWVKRCHPYLLHSSIV